MNRPISVVFVLHGVEDLVVNEVLPWRTVGGPRPTGLEARDGIGNQLIPDEVETELDNAGLANEAIGHGIDRNGSEVDRTADLDAQRRGKHEAKAGLIRNTIRPI